MTSRANGLTLVQTSELGVLMSPGYWTGRPCFGATPRRSERTTDQNSPAGAFMTWTHKHTQSKRALRQQIRGLCAMNEIASTESTLSNRSWTPASSHMRLRRNDGCGGVSNPFDQAQGERFMLDRAGAIVRSLLLLPLPGEGGERGRPIGKSISALAPTPTLPRKGRE
jgi:hypothetical protein